MFTYFIGKDKKTKWKKMSPSQTIRTHSKNIVTQLPGIKKVVRNVKTFGIWKLFFSDSQYSRQMDVKPTNTLEIQALLGLLLFAGIKKLSFVCKGFIQDRWIISPEIFRLIMSWIRLAFLFFLMSTV